MFYRIILVAIFGICTLSARDHSKRHAQNQNLFLILDSPIFGNGLFSVCTMVLGLLQHYENEKLAGCQVDFAVGGVYYDKDYGLNWWEYYFEPINLGSRQGAIVRKATIDEQNHFSCLTEFVSSKMTVNKYIQKYIRLKPHIKKKISDFKESYFLDSWVIGVHYRGTDKSAEAPRVTYETIAKEVEEVIKSNTSQSSIKIFVATDEQAFVDFMNEKFPEKTIYLEDAIRSADRNPVHKTVFGYKCGEDAVLDCILLSQCNILLRTSSNLSLFSTYFNPNIPVIELSKRHFQY